MKRVCLKCKWMLKIRKLLVVESRCRSQRPGRTLPANRRIFVGKTALECHQHMSAVVNVISDSLKQCIIGDVERGNNKKLVLRKVRSLGKHKICANVRVVERVV